MDVDQHFAGLGDAEQRIGLRGDLADPGADREQQIGLLDARDQGRGCPGPEIADKRRPAVVEDVLPAKRTAHWQIVRFGELGDVTAGGIAPPAAADQHHRALRRAEQAAHFGEVGRTGMRMHRVIWAGDLGGGAVAQHVLGQGQHDRAGPAGGRDLKRLVDEFGDAFGHVDLRYPFGERAEHATEIDFLKCLAVDLMAGDLANQDDHRRRILKCGVDAD